MKPYSLPPALLAIATARDHIQNSDFGLVLRRASQTVRKNYITTECRGVRLIKVGNRLLWPVSEIAAFLYGEAR
jgi:hypothetical protein